MPISIYIYPVLLLLLLIITTLLNLTQALTWHSLLYDTGLLGAHPRTKYESFDLASPEPNILKWDPRCEDKYVFLSPRGHFYPHPGPLIFDNKGDLVWMESRFGMVMDFRVQRYRGEDYLTFWVGEDDGTRGLGRYYMVCFFSLFLSLSLDFLGVRVVRVMRG